MTTEQLLILAILGAAIGMFLWGRWRHDMVHDLSRDRFVMFGGERNTPAGSVLLGDTWELAGNRWQQVMTPCWRLSFAWHLQQVWRGRSISWEGRAAMPIGIRRRSASIRLPPVFT